MLSSRPAPQLAPREGSILGFDSLPALLAFGALLLLLAISPLMLSGFWPSTYDFWPQALFLLVGAGGALLLAISPDSKPRLDSTAYLLLAFIGWNGLSILTTVYRHDSWLEWARVFGALLTFFAVRTLSNSSRVNWIIGAWVLGMAGVSLTPIQAFIQERSVGISWPFYNQNLLANALSMTLPVALIVPFLVRRATRSGFLIGLSAIPFFLCALNLLLTSSKGGFLSSLLALLVTGIMVLRAKSAVVGGFVKTHRGAFASGTVVFLILFGLVAAKTVLPRLQKARGADDNSTMFRAYIWRATTNMAKERPLTGFGPGSFPHVYSRFAQVGYTRSAHESWLQVAAESGFPALLLLLGAMLVALRAGGKRLKTSDWPFIAGMSGAVTALLAHGCVDSGFQTTSIVIFLAVALAILTAIDSPPLPSASRLNPFWLVATLLLALGGNQTQKAAAGEDTRDQAYQLIRNGAPSMAIQKEREAVGIDGGSARLWLDLGVWQDKSGGNGREALLTASQLQPTNSINWLNLGRNAEQHGNSADAGKYYDLAVENDSNGTHTLLESASYWIGAKNDRGYTTLEKIVSLWDAPYGRYAPVEQIVNLDFARATLLLAPKLKVDGQKARLKTLVQHALADCARARSFVAANEAMRQASGGEMAGDDNQDLETIASELQQLETDLK